MRTINKISLIDHENETMGPRAMPHTYSVLNQLLTSLVPGGLGHVAVGTSCGGSAVMFAANGFPGARHVYENGTDGAERALIGYMDEHFHDAIVDELVIASGDGAFVDLAAEYKQRGTKIVVVANRGTLSNHLRMVADEVIYLPNDWQLTYAA